LLPTGALIVFVLLGVLDKVSLHSPMWQSRLNVYDLATASQPFGRLF
jgi:hypothetical protein